MQQEVYSRGARRERTGPVVELSGWIRVPGIYARLEGMRVADLLKREAQVLPDTYRSRGEIVRTLEDGRTEFLAFNLDKALAGDPAHDLLLANRDRIELFRVDRLRLPKRVSISGPLTNPAGATAQLGLQQMPARTADGVAGSC